MCLLSLLLAALLASSRLARAEEPARTPVSNAKLWRDLSAAGGRAFVGFRHGAEKSTRTLCDQEVDVWQPGAALQSEAEPPVMPEEAESTSTAVPKGSRRATSFGLLLVVQGVSKLGLPKTI